MLRSAASKVMWVGRVTVFLVGLAVILALVVGVASTAMGANGDFFKLGRANVASAVSTLTKSGAGPALDLRVDRGPALKVNTAAKVPNLNADKIDGLDSSDLQGARAYAHIDANGTLDASRSKNVNRSLKISTGLYCLNSTVPPRNVVATISAFSGSGMISQESGDGLCSVNTESYNIQVRTLSSGGTSADRAFDVAIN